MMKKILAHFLLCFFVCSSTAFAEVPKDHWAAESIRFLEEKEVLLRLEALDANITRYEFVHLMNKTCLFTKKSERSFQDLSAADSRLPAFQTADFYGYVQGDENNCANPDNAITRGEVAAILARLYGLESDKQETSYADNAQLPKWCVPSVAALQEKGLFSGYEDNTFRAENTFTFAQAYTIAARVYKDVNSNSGFAGGNGTEKFPLKIATAAQFSRLNSNRDLFYEQIADINLSDAEAQSTAKYNPLSNFAGSYDGNGYKISGVDFTKLKQEQLGLFTKNTGTVKNIVLDGIQISAEKNAGGICAVNEGTISNCTVSGKITAEEYGGGITAFNKNGGIIENCTNQAAVNSKKYAGGIAGSNSGSVIDGCSNEGEIKATNESVGTCGGIAGVNTEAAEIKNSGHTGKGVVTGTENIGGIAGENIGSQILYCYNHAELRALPKGVSGKPYVYPDIDFVKSSLLTAYMGGICGSNTGTSAIRFCYNQYDISLNFRRTGFIGGISGKNTAEISDCYNRGGVHALIVTRDERLRCNAVSGGIAGLIQANAVLKNCYNAGDVRSESYIKYEDDPPEPQKLLEAPYMFSGGICGILKDEYYTFENVYHDIDTYTSRMTGNGPNVIPGVSQKRKAALKNKDSFQGFDFETVWTIGEVSGYDYPTLRSAPEGAA